MRVEAVSPPSLPLRLVAAPSSVTVSSFSRALPVPPPRDAAATGRIFASGTRKLTCPEARGRGCGATSCPLLAAREGCCCVMLATAHRAILACNSVIRLTFTLACSSALSNAWDVTSSWRVPRCGNKAPRFTDRPTSKSINPSEDARHMPFTRAHSSSYPRELPRLIRQPPPLRPTHPTPTHTHTHRLSM